jgi:hypothetical protein
VAFPAHLGGRVITCRISYSALMEYPDAPRRHHLTTFRAHRAAIEARAAAMLSDCHESATELIVG